MSMIANHLRESVARLRYAITSHQHLSCRGVIGEDGCGRPTLEDIEAERGVADRPGHHHAVAGLRTAAMDHLAWGHAPERRDRDHQGTGRRNRIATEQRAAEQARVFAERVRERLE